MPAANPSTGMSFNPFGPAAAAAPGMQPISPGGMMPAGNGMSGAYGEPFVNDQHTSKMQVNLNIREFNPMAYSAMVGEP